MRQYYSSDKMHLLNALLATAGIATASSLPPTRVSERAETCTPVAGGSPSTDDVPALQSAIADCPSGTIVIPAESTYYINSVFSFEGCAGCTLQIEGLLQVSSDTDYWNGKEAIFDISDITGATIYSTTGTGTIDGAGQASWDLFASDSSYDRPTLIWINNSNSITIQNLLFTNAPNVFHSARGDSSDITYADITLSAVSSSDNLPKNTDGWDIGPASYVSITNASVTNDDDCVAFKSGARYVSVVDITCAGSHGLSVGSLGSSARATDTVEHIYVSGATMKTSTKAAGIKLYPSGSDHGTAVVRNVTWENVVVEDCEYAFQIQSCYGEEEDYCENSPSMATLEDVVVRGFSGVTAEKYSPTVMNLDCPAAGTCGVTFSDITVEPPSGEAEFLCANTPDDLGVECTSGASG